MTSSTGQLDQRIPPPLRSASAGVHPAGLLGLIAERSATSPEGRYLVQARSDRCLSFARLGEEVERTHQWLDGSGLEAGARVGIAAADPMTFAVTYLGVLASGRWAVPLDPTAPKRSVAATLDRLRPCLVVGERPVPGPSIASWVDPDTFARGPIPVAGPSSPGEREVPDPGASRCSSGGAILLSSGTTGTPKAITLHQHQLLHTAQSVATHHRLTPDDVGFNPLPLFHVNAEVVGLLATLVAGATLVLDESFHRSAFWAVMDRHRVTWVNAVPAIVARLTDTRPGEEIPARIRFVRSASSPLAEATLRRFERTTGIPVVETYGMTEAASQITANPLDGPRKPGSVGVPVGVELRVVPQFEGGRTGPTEPGHVEIRGPAVTSAGRWLRSGDLGYLDDDGYLYLAGRCDDVINRGGEKMFPREIEEVILEDPSVSGAVVVPAPDEGLGQVPVAYVSVIGVSDRGDAWRATEVAERLSCRLADALPRSKRPVALHVTSRLPATATGKVRRHTLPAEAPEIIVTRSGR